MTRPYRKLAARHGHGHPVCRRGREEGGFPSKTPHQKFRNNSQSRSQPAYRLVSALAINIHIKGQREANRVVAGGGRRARNSAHSCFRDTAASPLRGARSQHAFPTVDSLEATAVKHMNMVWAWHRSRALPATSTSLGSVKPAITLANDVGHRGVGSTVITSIV